MKILSIDPGNIQSAYCIIEDYKPLEFNKIENEELLRIIHKTLQQEKMIVVIEMIASYGMAVRERSI